MKIIIAAAAFVAALFSSPLLAASTGNLVAFGDEWTFSDTAFSTSGDGSAQMTDNLADLFGGTNYLIATANTLAYASAFETYLATTLGKTVTRVSSETNLNASLAASDAVFLAGSVGTASIAALDSYLQNGGNVVVSLGTGEIGGNAASEAAAWNPLLNDYGLTAASSWTFSALSSRDVNASPLDLDEGVAKLTWGNGNEISLFGENPADGIITLQDGVNSIGAVGVSLGAAPVPLPAGLPLLLAGLSAFAVMRRRS